MCNTHLYINKTWGKKLHKYYRETHKTVNTGKTYGMLLCLEEKTYKAPISLLFANLNFLKFSKYYFIVVL